MSLVIFLAVLLAAFLHALWNVLVRQNADRLISLTALQTAMGVMGLAMIALFGLPSRAAMVLAIVSGLLHTGYNLFLVRAYRSADLSQVYPVARGSAPLMTMIGGFLMFHDSPGPMGVLAILVLVAGLLTTSFGQNAGVKTDPHAMLYAFGTACFIAVYTLVDGQGARTSGNALGYAGLLFVLDGVFLLIATYLIRGRRFSGYLKPQWRSGILGALASGTAYAIVIWAMTQAPVASVAALRETSIVFVLLMSSRVLNETLTRNRILGGALIAAGAVLLRIA
jgi:drug/metabolite transporter (DMT)-like permease